MGVGGGFLLVPAMIYLLRIPTRIVIGTSTFQIVCVTAFATVMQATLNHTVDLLLSLPLMAGSVIGAQFGVGYAERFKAEQLRALLALIVLAVAVRMAFGLVIRPIRPVQHRCAALNAQPVPCKNKAPLRGEAPCSLDPPMRGRRAA